MEDLSKEKQIEQLENDITECYGCDPLYYGTDGNYLAKELVEMGWRKQEWISVDEGLPEKEGQYLVYTGLCGIRVCRFRTSIITDRLSFEYNCTHWMPLPEPPKMKGGAE